MANTLKFGNGEWYGKKDTILAYNDENSNYKPLPFNFTRASSATRVNKDGLIETVGSGIPRIDFQGNTKGALLLEPSRTNYQPYSTDFSVWSVADVTVNLSYGLSPDGLNNSVLITEGTGSAQHRIVKGSPSSSGIYTFSCFVKNKVGNRQAYIDMGAVTGFFNFDTKTMYSATGTANVESWSNDWYRISITSNSNITPSAVYIGTGKNNTETFQGDGSSAIEFFAPQLELGSYATSYIPTQGSAVTRLAESCSQTVPDGVIGQTEGVLFGEFSTDANDNNSNWINLSDGTSNNWLFIGKDFTNVRAYLKSNGVVIFSNQSTALADNNKVALSYKSGNIKVYINGVQILSISSSFTFSSALNQLNFGAYNGGVTSSEASWKQLKLYNTILTDNELAALTQV